MKRRALQRRYGHTSGPKLSRATLIRHLANDLQTRNPRASRRIVMAWVRNMNDLPMIAFGRGLITRAEYTALGGNPNDLYAGSK